MRQHRFSEEQMGAILSEPDLGAVVEAERNRNVSAQTIYIWRRKFGYWVPTVSNAFASLSPRAHV